MSAGSDDGQQRRLDSFRDGIREHAGKMSVAWIRFEQDRSKREIASELLRDLHTIKGEASLMDFAAISGVVHALEAVIQGTASSSTELSREAGDLILEGFDLIASLVSAEPGTPSDETDDYVARLDAACGDVLEAKPGDRDTLTPPASERKKPDDRGTHAVKVSTEQLQRMQNIIGELLLSRTRLRSSASQLRKTRLGTARDDGVTSMLGSIEAQLRDDVLRMGNLVSALEDLTRDLRTVPIGVLFDRYPRAVRELSHDLGKQVRLVIEGEAVEIDREVLEALEGPLLHLVRNALDHGIEEPAVRRRAGKLETGTFSLRASVAGNLLEVVVSDDGAGIDIATVRARAIEREVIDAESALALSDEEILECLFVPGMSTRDTVTQVSGRGVGLDVAREYVESLGGELSIQSERGAGTTFRLSVPINVAVSSVVLFRVGGGHYALPASSVRALVNAADSDEVDSIEGLSVRFRGELVPRVSLHAALDESVSGVGADGPARIVIIGSGKGQIALTGSFDHVQQDVVLKPAGGLIADHPLISGGVALEDGTVALVLNPKGLVETRRGRRRVSDEPPRRARTILVVDDSPVVLDLVAETLRSYGMTVVEAVDGEDALAKLEAHPEIDLLVTDVDMPRLDGLQLIRRLRSREGSRRLPAVVVSTRASDEDKLAAVEVGADGYLAKSDFSRDGLWKLVSRYLH